ncbi:MAG: LysM peptidoglycan-binding domain-containing protein [Bacteroidia bacterium]
MANCPVCNKTGLPDYRTEAVVCPQCNSNLKAFKLLSGLFAHKPTTKRSFISIGIIGVLFILLLWQFLSNQKTETTKTTLDQVPTNTVADSSEFYKKRITELQNNLAVKNSQQEESTVSYTIKKGDCLTKIALMFYNDWQRFEEIEKLNNLVKPYNLRVGQTIKIKLKNE